MNSLESEAMLSACQATGRKLSLFKRISVPLLAIFYFFAPGTMTYFAIKYAKKSVREDPRIAEAFQLMWEVIEE